MPVYVELVKAPGVIVARFNIVDTDTGHSNSATVRVELRRVGVAGARTAGREEHGGPASADTRHRHPLGCFGNGSFPA